MVRKFFQEKINEILRFFYEEYKKRIEIYRIMGVL